METFAWAFFLSLLAVVQLPLSTALPNCPLAGPEFPPPQRLSQHPKWKEALYNASAMFDFIELGGTGGVNNLSYSIQVFSTNPGGGILGERHRTAPNLLADTPGVKQVDGNTIYRLGSVSKVFAVMAWLAELGDVHWNMPITSYIPELASQAMQEASTPFDSVRHTSWDDITIGSLASQVSGVGRDYGVLGEITQTEDFPPEAIALFPTLSESTKPPCGAWPLCTREFFRGLAIMYPSYPPWQTPTYSNVGYQLFTYALENITGKKFVDILDERVIKPLGLNNTYYENAPISAGIIPGSLKDSYWYVNLGDADPGGNMYSSASDLSTLGQAILSSRLIKPSLTRRWLNPVTFSADIAASVGAPWGIRRIQLDKEAQPSRSISVFTKAGTFRKYTSFITLLKEYNLGFTIMMAGEGALTNFGVADFMGAALIPAYDAAARDEADELFSGTYISAEVGPDGITPSSSIIITTDPKKPGLGIVSWISNGVNMLETALKLSSGTSYTPLNAEARLYYTQLETRIASGVKRQSWKAIFEDTGLPSLGPGLFSTTCGAWVSVTGVTYGSLPLDEFVFSFDSAGRVRSITNLALRSTLYKTYPRPTQPFYPVFQR